MSYPQNNLTEAPKVCEQECGVFGDSFDAVAHLSKLVHCPRQENAHGQQQSNCLVCIVFAYTAYFSRSALARTGKEEEKKKKWNKMEKKVEYSGLVFSSLLKVSGTYKVNLAIEQQKNLV